MTSDELKRWMEAAGYFDPVEIGKALGVHRTTVERWLKGESAIRSGNLRKVLQLQPKRVFARRFEEHKAQWEARRRAEEAIPLFEIVEFDLAPPVTPGPIAAPAAPEVEPDFPRDAAPVQPAARIGTGGGRGNLRPAWRRPRILAAGLVASTTALALAMYAVRSRHPEPQADDAPLPVRSSMYDFTSAPEMIPLDDTSADAGVSAPDAPAEAGAKKGRPIPDTPLEGQLRAPCPSGHAALKGGCWSVGVDQKNRPQHAPCPEAQYEYEDYCYVPTMGKAGKPLPNTVEPKESDGR